MYKRHEAQNSALIIVVLPCGIVVAHRCGISTGEDEWMINMELVVLPVTFCTFEKKW